MPPTHLHAPCTSDNPSSSPPLPSLPACNTSRMARPVLHQLPTIPSQCAAPPLPRRYRHRLTMEHCSNIVNTETRGRSLGVPLGAPVHSPQPTTRQDAVAPSQGQTCLGANRALVLCHSGTGPPSVPPYPPRVSRPCGPGAASLGTRRCVYHEFASAMLLAQSRPISHTHKVPSATERPLPLPLRRPQPCSLLTAPRHDDPDDRPSRLISLPTARPPSPLAGLPYRQGVNSWGG